MKLLFITFAILSFAFVTTGCGQSGPLYIPGNPSQIQNPPQPPQQPEEEEEEEEEENGDDNDDIN